MKCTYRVTPKLYEKSYNEELITNNEPFTYLEINTNNILRKGLKKHQQVLMLQGQ